MTVEQEVDALTAAVDTLKSTVVSKKATLDASVSDAQAATALATTAKTAALSARDQASASKDAAYAYAQSAGSAVAYQDLTALAASKAVTAVDVFIYDTSKDSDGGAWRHRCTGTSWYNETLNTATRGSRRAFPAVAVIVAEASKVTIYDGDDPSLPMWMVFNAANTNNLLRNAGALSVAMTNAQLVVATAQAFSSITAFQILFAADSALGRNASGAYEYTTNLADRNSGVNGYTFLSGSGAIINPNINDVAMTVLPDAPIDPATELQVPTIAVATAGGLSVIRDDGTVQSSAGEAHFGVAFAPNGTLLVQDQVFNKNYQFLVLTDSGFVGVGAVGNILTPNQSRANSGRGVFIDNTTVAFNGASTVGVNSLPCLQTYKLNLSSDRSAYMNALTTSTYNTGWMNGDIKGAFLAGTDDTDLVGSGELVTNGTFDTDVSGWTGNSATLSRDTTQYPAGALQIDITANGGVAYQAITTVAGSRYTVNIIAKGTATANAVLTVGTGIGAGNLVSAQIIGSGATEGNESYTFVATGTTTYVNIGPSGAAPQTCYVDNVSVKLADADRSVNNKGLIVNGTVTRTPVATGADLVGYGVWGDGYLTLPSYTYSTTTCFMFWGKNNNLGDAFAVWFSNPATLNTISSVFRTDSSAFRVSGEGLNVSKANTAGWNNQWAFYCMLFDGTAFSLYENGVLVGTGTLSTALSGVGSIRIGDYRTENARRATFALLRISATAPTAEQIKKIYEDEKVLFQENAACTLYGASDAVTTLAHDSDTGLLHVGTSAGRSVFQGLRRVANTTTPVTTAIAASGGMVVEE